VTSSTKTVSTGTRRSPLQYFATIGAVLALFEVYLLVKWVAGPSFAEVPYGPTEPPTWMKIAVHTAEVVFLVAAVVCFYQLIVRPWRRERRIGFDGLLMLAAVATSVYDPLQSYFHTWMGYNSYFVNRGNPMTVLPGWQTAGEPASAVAWPMLFLPPLYAVLFVGIAAVCCTLMGRAKSRWPGIPVIGLAAIAFLTVVALDLIAEGQILMRLGFYEESGQSIPFLDSYYSHNPLRNIVGFAVIFTAAACLRFYRNDRGETLVERGAHQMGGSPGKVTALRFFAVLTATQACMFFGYHVPVAITTLVDPHAEWHQGMVQSSFLNNHMCGAGSSTNCPAG
jgi:hypothetical protein